MKLFLFFSPRLRALRQSSISCLLRTTVIGGVVIPRQSLNLCYTAENSTTRSNFFKTSQARCAADVPTLISTTQSVARLTPKCQSRNTAHIRQLLHDILRKHPKELQIWKTKSLQVRTTSLSEKRKTCCGKYR